MDISHSQGSWLDSAVEGPQVTSPDPEERILARRQRIQKRNAASRKRLQNITDGKELSSDEEVTVLEQQVEKSTIELLTLSHEGKELITNVRVAADAHEVKRRIDQAAAKDVRIQKLENEANIAQQKFETINSKWESIAVLNDPLNLHQETEMQREKCVDLISQKDQLIADLKAELKAGDVRFVKDQQKQAEDIALLVERIDNQIAIMRRAYRQELVLIEQAIDIERRERMEVNNKRWEALYKQREEDEAYNLEQRFVALSEHNQLMQSILVHHQEKFRATKISLEKDIQVLQQQLEQVKAICLLNKEKMEYNYQVLKKRDEESLLIRSQQKRRINKLQDMVTTLRRKILAVEQSTQSEVKRLTSEVIKLHRNIKDIQLKAEHFCTVNETKYFQLWKFNHDSAQKLLDKILSMDRLVHEQQLAIAWQPAPAVVISKQDLPSYQAASDKVITKNRDGIHLSPGNQWEDREDEKRLQQILEAVADRSGFLVEERLNVLLAPYTHSQNTLVRIDNVFNALGVTRQEDMDLLKQTMKRYLVCVTCQPILEAVLPISPPPTPVPPVLSEEEMKSRVMKKLKDTLEEGEKAGSYKREKIGDLEGSSEFGEILAPTADNDSDVGSTLSPWACNFEINVRSMASIFPTAASYGGMKSPSVAAMIYSHKTTSSAPDLSTISAPTPTLSLSESEFMEAQDEKVEEGVHDSSHVQSINPVFVLKALREFVQQFQANKNRYKTDAWENKVNEKKSISRQLSDRDVKKYWEQFRTAFPPEREKLWDCLYMGLQQYHTVLQERHRINAEIEQLKVQNADLRRLLQKYALPNNMKPTKGPRQNLPPLSVKMNSAPNRLVLTFNNTSIP